MYIPNKNRIWGKPSLTPLGVAAQHIFFYSIKHTEIFNMTYFSYTYFKNSQNFTKRSLLPPPSTINDLKGTEKIPHTFGSTLT